MRPVKFENNAYSDFIEWANSNKSVLKKITELIKDIDRNGDCKGHYN